jgi:metal-responsive CopG/Arc/MetJ family transcriptional regulator
VRKPLAEAVRRVLVSLPAEYIQALDALALEAVSSRCAVIRLAIADYVSRRKTAASC